MEIEDGKKSPTFDKVMQLLHAYRADVQDFLRETGYLPKNVEPAALGKMRRIPVISWVAAGKWSETGESFHTEDAKEWIESDIKGENNFALRVKGDSMEPEFNDGDIIIVSPHVHPVAAHLSCRIVTIYRISRDRSKRFRLPHAATGQVPQPAITLW